MKTFYWDFYGPRAAGTAQHFVVHLKTFLERASLPSCETGVENPSSNHHAAWCKAPPEGYDTISQALRPQRAVSAMQAQPDAQG